jgi:hypothetical protein
MVIKHILCAERLRCVPKQFSWVDHRLVRDKRICGLSHPALALYLFLVTVSDGEGLSYYSDAALQRYLGLDTFMAKQARLDLCQAGLIAYSRPLYQVLSLDRLTGLTSATTIPCESAPARHDSGKPESLGELLHGALGGAR